MHKLLKAMEYFFRFPSLSYGILSSFVHCTANHTFVEVEQRGAHFCLDDWYCYTKSLAQIRTFSIFFQLFLVCRSLNTSIPNVGMCNLSNHKMTHFQWHCHRKTALYKATLTQLPRKIAFYINHR